MNLQALYRERERQIKSRLRDFEMMRYRSDRDVFAELCFCLLTPGTHASRADAAVRQLADTGLLFSGTEEQIAAVLRGKVRFFNTKARNIVAARAFLDIRNRLRGTAQEMRLWLVEAIPGLGWKEASHFLRNIGYGEGLAIIDRHILRSLKRHRLIPSVPAAISGQRYLELEQKVRDLAAKVGIPMEELDLLLWSRETGSVFK